MSDFIMNLLEDKLATYSILGCSDDYTKMSLKFNYSEYSNSNKNTNSNKLFNSIRRYFENNHIDYINGYSENNDTFTFEGNDIKVLVSTISDKSFYIEYSNRRDISEESKIDN